MTTPAQNATAQHTPGKWGCQQVTFSQPIRRKMWIGTKDDHVAECSPLFREAESGAEALHSGWAECQANAAYIVLACNAHEELLAAAREARDAENCWNEEGGEGWERCKCRQCATTRRLHAAIAKATP